MGTFESLKKLLREFYCCCPPNMLVSVTFGNSLPIMTLYNVCCIEPDILIFDYATCEKAPARIIQHTSQLNISLAYVTKPKDAPPQNPIGFRPWEDKSPPLPKQSVQNS